MSDLPRRRALSHYPVHTLHYTHSHRFVCLVALSAGHTALRSYRDAHTRRQTGKAVSVLTLSPCMVPVAGNWRCVVGGGASDAGHVDNATPTPGCSCSCSARRVLKITHRIDPDACLQIIVLSALLTNPPKPTVDVSNLLVVLLVMCNPSPKYTLDFSSTISLTNSPTLVAYYLILPFWLMVVVGEGIPPG